MEIRIRDFDLHLVRLRARFPFRYGIATMTEVPQLLFRLFTEIRGTPQIGFSAEMLAPKWFAKKSDQSLEAERLELLAAIRHAGKIACGLEASSAFEAWQQLYAGQRDWGAEQNLPPLLSHLG